MKFEGKMKESLVIFFWWTPRPTCPFERNPMIAGGPSRTLLEKMIFLYFSINNFVDSSFVYLFYCLGFYVHDIKNSLQLAISSVRAGKYG